MIFDILPNSHRYLAMHQGFDAAFAFLRRPDLKTLATDKYPIDGERIYAMVAHDPGRNKDEAQLEVHEKYIDIQMLLAGCARIGDLPWLRSARLVLFPLESCHDRGQCGCYRLSQLSAPTLGRAPGGDYPWAECFRTGAPGDVGYHRCLAAGTYPVKT